MMTRYPKMDGISIVVINQIIEKLTASLLFIPMFVNVSTDTPSLNPNPEIVMGIFPNNRITGKNTIPSRHVFDVIKVSMIMPCKNVIRYAIDDKIRFNNKFLFFIFLCFSMLCILNLEVNFENKLE